MYRCSRLCRKSTGFVVSWPPPSIIPGGRPSELKTASRSTRPRLADIRSTPVTCKRRATRAMRRLPSAEAEGDEKAAERCARGRREAIGVGTVFENGTLMRDADGCGDKGTI